MGGVNVDAQRVFDAGVLSLGIPIDGLEVERDIEYAGLAFKRATEYDPDMCDAWLGRAAAGEGTTEVVHHLHRTSKFLGREQRRLGLPRRALTGRFETGLYLDYTMSTFTEIRLAYAASLIQGQDYDEAERILDDLAATRDDAASEEICAYIRGILHFTTQRWPDVLTALANSASHLASADDALSWVVEGLAHVRVTDDAQALRIDVAGLPGELQRRLLLHAFTRFHAPEPRGGDLTRALDALSRGQTVTLAGMKLEGGATWRLSRAPQRRPPE